MLHSHSNPKPGHFGALQTHGSGITYDHSLTTRSQQKQHRKGARKCAEIAAKTPDTGEGSIAFSVVSTSSSRRGQSPCSGRCQFRWPRT